MNIVGIDPGFDGALCVLDAETGRIVAATCMVTHGVDAVKRVDIMAVRDWLHMDESWFPDTDTVCVEKIMQWSGPRGANAGAVFRQEGSLWSLADIAGCTLLEGPAPHEWKEPWRPVDVPYRQWHAKGWQAHFAQIAESQWPDDVDRWYTKGRRRILDGVLSALFIAEWARAVLGHKVAGHVAG